MRGSRHNIDRETWRASAALYAARGTALPQAKATPDLVRKIRANRSGLPRRAWADATGLHIRTIEKIATYETWRHIK